MSDTRESGGEPSSDDVVAFLFRAAMSGDEAAYAAEHGFDPKLVAMWKFTHAQEYIAYLESILRVMRTRGKPAS